MRSPLIELTVVILSLAASGVACRRAGPPYEIKDALATFRIEAGFRIEPYVTEPDIRSPVAMDVDEDGRTYVVEDPGYPLNVEGKVGRIILLEDVDGDGTPDRRTIFADKLTMPTGIMRWKKGVLVTDAPDILYLEDSDGDGKADIRKVLLTGFAFTNPQHTVNSPVYGLDNWISVAHEGPATAIVFPEQFGDRGSDIRFPDRPGSASLRPARRMVRFRPDTGQLEYRSSSSQFGQGFDAWGHQFTVSNEDHIREEVIAAQYVVRNPDLAVGSVMARISDHRPAADVFPITHRPRVEMLSGVGSFTSACGITMYLGGAFPSSMGLFALVAEPAQNLVHRDVLAPSGATYIATRAHERAEFLASSDPWFRPVNFYNGPDGAIYLVDYYRLVIEHPEWMATHTHHSPDLYKGDDRGRIYRITPEGGLPRAGRIRLGQASTPELVNLLTSPNIWYRRTAQRLLVDRGGFDAVAPLEVLLATTRSAVARLHALWTLEGLQRLDTSQIARALDDPEAGVRENAMLLAEPRLSRSPELVAKLLEHERDSDGRVRFQLLCTLGGVDSPASRAAQDRLLAGGIEDPWMQIAALSASSDRAPQLFDAASAFSDRRTDARTAYFRQVSAVIGTRRRTAEVRRVLASILNASADTSSWWRAASLEGLAQGLAGSGPRGGNAQLRADLGQDLLLALFERSDGEVRRGSLRALAATGLPVNAAPVLQRAAATAIAGDRDAALRADAVGLLTIDDPATHEALFKTLIDPQQPEAVQAAAVRGLGRVKGAAVGTFLTDRWGSMTPGVRTEAADAMFLDPARPRLLLDAIKRDAVQPWTLAFRHKRQLLMSADASLRDEARALLEEKPDARQQMLKRYEAALEKSGDPERGRAVFDRVCARCHKLNGLGHDVGPDLATIRNRPPDLILPDIVMPSRSIAQGYESYVVETKSRGILEGVLGAQTPTTVTLRHEGGAEDVIRRDDIRELRVTKLSAMPTDLDKQISVDQMADLLRFLKQ